MRGIEIEPVWFAIHATYSRETAFKEYLDIHHVENFIPMCHQAIIKKAEVQRKHIPVKHHLFFVRTTWIKVGIVFRIPLRYNTDRTTNLPINIQRKQIQNFIVVTNIYNKQLFYLNPTIAASKKRR